MAPMGRGYRKYESGNSKRKNRKKREQVTKKQKNLEFFLEPSQDAKENREDTDGPSTVTSAAPCDGASTENLKNGKHVCEDTETKSSQKQQSLLDIALWPDILTENMRSEILVEHPQNIGNPQNAGILVKDRDRTYFRHFSDRNFYIEKPNGRREKREWLIYSETSRSVFCYICKLFSNKHTQFAMRGCSDWKNIAIRISDHECSEDHKQCMLIFCQLSHLKGRIDTELTKAIKRERQYWREALKRVVATVKFLSSLGLAFRGHYHNDGHYISCFEYLAEFDVFFEQHMKKYANRGPGSVSYLSKKVCDEFIEIMGESLREQFIKEVKMAIYFSLIIDSTPDVSHVDQLAFVLRYVLPNGLPKERFFTFVDIYSHSAESLEKVVLETLNKWGIDVRKCRGQTYDNASNMSGKYSGLQARIKEHSPSAEFIPCSSHSLNLIGNAAAESSPTAIAYFDFVQEIYVLFSASTQRWDVLQTHLQKNACTVKKISDTRWSARADAVFALYKSYCDIKQALTEVGNDPRQKWVTRAEAAAIAIKMNSYDMALMTVMWNKLLQRMNATSKSLQNPELSLSTAVGLLESLKRFVVSEVRDHFATIEAEAAPLVAGNCVYRNEQRRSKKRKTFFDENSENEVHLSERENFIVNVLNSICDKLVMELDMRMSVFKEVDSRFGFLFGNENMPEDEIDQKIDAFVAVYNEDIDCDAIGNELLQFLAFAKQEGLKTPSAMYQLILRGLQSTFPNVETILRIYLTIPISNASGERSFSVLKRVKNYLRNSIGQDRLANLAILCIESEEMKKCDFDEQIDKFAKAKSRRVVL